MSAAPTFQPRVLLRAEQSGGAVSVMENAAPGRWAGPPLHHHDFDEGFYVLEGTPAGFERYFARIAAEQAGEEPPQWALGETPPTVVVGPPIELGEEAVDER